jgi:dienelactone hydrolase
MSSRFRRSSAGPVIPSLAEIYPRAGGERIRSVGTALLACLGLACTFTPRVEPEPLREAAPPVDPYLTHRPLAPEDVKVTAEPITVEDAFILDLYTFFHSKDYTTFRVEYPSDASDVRGNAVAHLLIPPGEGPHPTVVVFDILAGSHVVGEAMAKALVDRGFLAARLERADLKLDTAERAEVPAETLRGALLDARRLLDYLETRPDVDRARIGVAGVSLGSILACVLQGVDPRVRAGVLIMSGGDLAAILGDSSEVPVRLFREHTIEREGLADADAFIERMRPLIDPMDPLRHASNIDPRSVLFITARLDRVIRPPHQDALWAALGKPERIVLPFGHYQLLPFFWWSIARGAEHLNRVLEIPAESAAQAPTP